MKGTILRFLLGMFFGWTALVPIFGQLPKGEFAKNLRSKWDWYVSNIIKLADKDNHLALTYADSLEGLAPQMNDSIYVAKAHRFKGQILRRLDRTGEAICEYQMVAQIAKRHNFMAEYGYALNGMAVIFNHEANYEMALKLNFELLDYRERDGDCEEIATTLQNIGSVYLQLSYHEEALKYFNKVLDFSTEYYLKELVLVNMGLCYVGMKDFVTAQRFLEEGLRICGDSCSSYVAMPGYSGLGALYLFLSRYDLSELNFNRSYKLAGELDNKRFQLASLTGLADIRIRQNRFDDSDKLLGTAMALVKQTNYKEMRLDIYRAYADLFLKRKELERASIYQSRYIGLKESIHSLQIAKKWGEVNIKMETSRNLLTINYQQEILELKEEKIRTHQMINWLTGIVGFLLLVVTVVLFRTNYRRWQINRLLDRKVKERTDELGNSYANLKRSQELRNHMLDRASADLGACIASISGLHSVASRDPEIPESVKKYLNEFELISGHLRKVLERFKSAGLQNEAGN